MARQSSDTKELRDWVRLMLSAGYFASRPTVTQDLLDAGLDLQDVIHVLMYPDSVVGAEFAIGTYTFRGRTVDGEGLATVIAEPSEKNTVKILKVWKG